MKKKEWVYGVERLLIEENVSNWMLKSTQTWEVDKEYLSSQCVFVTIFGSKNIKYD